MKRKRVIMTVLIIILILIIPVPSGMYKDGGTRSYNALSYKIVKWMRLVPSELSAYEHPFIKNGALSMTSVYFFPENFKSLDDLFGREMREITLSDEAVITEVTKDNWTEYFEEAVIEGRRIHSKVNERDAVTVEYYIKLKDEYKNRMSYRGSDNASGFTAVVEADMVKSCFSETEYLPGVKDAEGIYTVSDEGLYEFVKAEKKECRNTGFQSLEEGGLYLYLTGLSEDTIYINEDGSEKMLYVHYLDPEVTEIRGTLYMHP
ncbi:MAG: hypothetical protein IJM49_04345 [Firmicutes bacterium]|nr:hypothetical protein [Bacillota bacterium]